MWRPCSESRAGIELLRQLCESEGVKTITWESDAGLLKKEQIPTEFTTTSKVCFIANDWARLNARLMALEDRAIVVSFEPDALEVHEQIGREGWFKDAEIYAFIGTNLGIIACPSIALVHQGIGDQERQEEDRLGGIGLAVLFA